MTLDLHRLRELIAIGSIEALEIVDEAIRDACTNHAMVDSSEPTQFTNELLRRIKCNGFATVETRERGIFRIKYRLTEDDELIFHSIDPSHAWCWEANGKSINSMSADIMKVL